MKRAKIVEETDVSSITPVPPPLSDGTCPTCKRYKVCEEPASNGIASLACLCGYRYYGAGHHSIREAREEWLKEEKERILRENKKLGLYYEPKDKTEKPDAQKTRQTDRKPPRGRKRSNCAGSGL